MLNDKVKKLENTIKEMGFFEEYEELRKKLRKDYNMDLNESRIKACDEIIKKAKVSLASKEPIKKLDKKIAKQLSTTVELHEASEFSKEQSNNPVETFDWIYNNIGITDVDPKSAPSPGAYTHLMHIRKEESAQSDFYKLYTNKKFPSSSKWDELIDRMADDGRSVSTFVEKIISEIKAV